MHPADFYTGIVAEVYGALRATHFSTDRYRSFVAEHGTPALELGCGDAGPFYDLAGTGLDIEGVDSSVDMVRRGRDRLAAEGIDVPVHHQRMEEMELSRSFASLYLAGPTFNLLPDDATALRALRAIAAHLQPDGAALVPLWTPPPTPSDQIGVARTSRVGDAEARYIVIGEDYDTGSRTRTTRARYELVADGNSTAEDREWIIHWYDTETFRGLCRQAGLDIATTTEIDDAQTELVLRIARS